MVEEVPRRFAAREPAPRILGAFFERIPFLTPGTYNTWSVLSRALCSLGTETGNVEDINKTFRTSDAHRDSGGRLPAVCCNVANSRLWKAELQRFADRSGIAISVSHWPPGTSKWNKIEHRVFCHITENWRGRPLVDSEPVVQLVGSVRTTAGVTVKTKLDTRECATGIKVSEAKMDTTLITNERFHGEWNYTIHSRRSA